MSFELNYQFQLVSLASHQHNWYFDEALTMKLKPIVLLFSLALLMGLSGCGNKGSLTLPDDEKKTERQSTDY